VSSVPLCFESKEINIWNEGTEHDKAVYTAASLKCLVTRRQNHVARWRQSERTKWLGRTTNKNPMNHGIAVVAAFSAMACVSLSVIAVALGVAAFIMRNRSKSS